MLSNRRTVRSTIIAEGNVQRDYKAIHDFIADTDVPHWFRGLSSFQVDAAHTLHSALRDDAEQNTAHRVIECLNLLGLKPIISHGCAKFLMRISRGNDLAFLWFLMDVQYKSKSTSHGYNLNEQIIMSCIATLDMVTTMRALDQILPPAQPTKKELERQQHRARVPKKPVHHPLSIDLMRSRHRPKYSLPYFIPLERPKPFGKPLTSAPPDHRMTFGIFEEYSNQYYGVPNESNRWYANYELQPTRRIAESTKNELLTRILAHIKADDIANKHKQPRSVGSENSTDEQEDEQLVEKSVCEKHRIINELEKSLEHELKVIARERCMKYFDVVTSKKEATRKRIQDQLEHDVTLYTEQFRRLADSRRKSVSYMHLITKDDLCAYSPDVIDKENLCCPAPKGRCARPQSSHKILSEQKKNIDQAGVGQKVKEPPVGDCKRKCPAQKLKPNKDCRNRIGDGPGALVKHAVRVARGNTCDCGYEYVRAYDYGHSECRSDSSTFFAAPTKHQPYRFDYRKIFDPTENEPHDASSDIGRTCLKAVDSDAHLEDMNSVEPLDMDGAVKKTAKKIFQKELAIHQESTSERERENNKYKKTPLNYDASYYDPDDTPLMNKMLEDALALLAKDPKYVLASMPDAHKHPVLRFWVYRRFGKVYNGKEQAMLWNKSLRIFHALYNLTLDVKLPSARSLGPALYIDYTCRNYIMKKSKHIREVYYKYLDASIMEQARTLYWAMAPFMCPGGAPRKTYFAYMPPRTMDIHHFHVWKPTEFRDLKGAHHSRIVREAKEHTLSPNHVIRL